ncbi:MAG: PD40 domain-containing protein [Myxococcaceae bacterium]|nr:PD40 domain-containing protein [Myxococcaceae bacterium]
MKRLLFLSALAFTACDFLPGGGGGTGGGSGGGGGSEFSKGFIFVRRDDRNLYAADERDFSSSKQLTTSGGARSPSLSRDGKRVVFVRTVGAETEVATVAVTGGTVSTVISSAAMGPRNARTPVFTPDGTKIVFAFDEGGLSKVGIVDTDGTNFRTVSTSTTLSYAGLSMYPDGSGVLAAAGSSTSMLTQVEKVSLSAGSGMNVVSSLGAEADAITSRVVLSPDGTKAAFDARLKGESAVRIFVLDLTTKAITQLTDYPGDQNASDASPCWLGNDKVCFSSDTGGNDQVYALPSTAMKTSGGLQLAGATEPWYGPNP